jgi:hypothetical protein
MVRRTIKHRRSKKRIRGGLDGNYRKPTGRRDEGSAWTSANTFINSDGQTGTVTLWKDEDKTIPSAYRLDDGTVFTLGGGRRTKRRRKNKKR